MPSRKKKLGSPSTAQAACRPSSAREDWLSADPLHAPRSAASSLVLGLAPGGRPRSCHSLVLLSASPSGGGESVSLQTARSCYSSLTPTVVLQPTFRSSTRRFFRFLVA